MATPKPKDRQKEINGVNVSQIIETIRLVRKQPESAEFKFNARNEWLSGGHCRIEIKDFYGAGEVQRREKPFAFDADEPPVLAGTDQGANPVEYLLTALSACLTTTMAYHAAVQGIEIEQIESEYEGDIDLKGFLDLDPNVRKGYREIRVKFKVKSEADEAKLLELAKKSPVFDVVTNPTPVKLVIEKQRDV